MYEVLHRHGRLHSTFEVILEAQEGYVAPMRYFDCFTKQCSTFKVLQRRNFAKWYLRGTSSSLNNQSSTFEVLFEARLICVVL
jgi:hypothetical protein